MKKIIAIVTAAALMLSITGCGNDNAGNGDDNKLSGNVAVDGSTSMEKVIGFLMEAYMEMEEGVKITYNPTGSGSGIQAVSEGRCDIGLSSRNLTQGESETMTGTVVALDGIAVVVNPNNPISDLTIAQIASIYKGEITNWKEAGGNDAPIVIIGREAASGTREGFEAITKTKEECKYTQELTSTGDVVQTVASNPNAIGYASLESVKSSVKAIKVEGVEPTNDTIKSGEYKIQRSFIFVTRRKGKLNEAAEAFLEFALSEAAEDLIVRAGAVPVKR